MAGRLLLLKNGSGKFKGCDYVNINGCYCKLLDGTYGALYTFTSVNVDLQLGNSSIEENGC